MRISTFDPRLAFEGRARELHSMVQQMKSDTGRQRRAAEMGTGTDAAYDRALDATTAKMEGEVDRRLQQLAEAAGAVLSPAEIEDALKAAGWSADERADALRGQGLRYREAR